MDRRDFLAAGVALGALPLHGRPRAGGGDDRTDRTDPGAVKYSVTRWPFPKLTVDELARAAAGMGLQSVELLEPDEWATGGWNRADNHAWLLPGYRKGLALAASAGVPNVICFSGSRGGQGDDEGITTCAAGLRALMPDAERLGVTVCMELLNSKVDHPDYQCDHTAWGARLVERVGSPRFRLLYDIYHMQIMEGDVIRTIREHHAQIAHYHIAGIPGRHEPDNSQELYYPAVMRAIAATGFTGYAAQEFIPTGEPLAALAEAVRICRV